MKTTIRSAVLTLALTVGAAAAAQAQTATPAQPGQPGRHGRHAMQGAGREGRGDHGMLKGIAVSEAQKAQLRTVREKYKAQHEAERARLEPVMDEVRAARQRGDTAAARAAWAKAGDARTQWRSVREQEMREMRAVLTADQQKQLDANVAAMKAERGQWAGRKGQGRKGQGRMGRGA